MRMRLRLTFEVTVDPRVIRRSHIMFDGDGLTTRHTTAHQPHVIALARRRTRRCTRASATTTPTHVLHNGNTRVRNRPTTHSPPHSTAYCSRRGMTRHCRTGNVHAGLCRILVAVLPSRRHGDGGLRELKAATTLLHDGCIPTRPHAPDDHKVGECIF